MPRTAVFRRLAPAILVLASLALAPLPAAVAQPLERQIRDLVGRAKIGQAEVGICVVDVSSGERLVGINEKRAFAPASNLKVLTSGAALMVLGKDFDFRTRLVRDGDRLIVIGGGDPGFADPKLLEEMKLSVGGFVDRLADAVRTAGFTGIREVVVDDRVFDRNAVHPSWPDDQLNRWYCAEVSGLNFHANVLQIFATGAQRPGSAPALRTEPEASWIEVNNAAQTVATGASAIAVFREGPEGFRFKVTGSVRSIPMEPVEVSVFNPALLFGKLLADRLQAAGLAPPGKTISARQAIENERFSTESPLTVVRTPIKTVLQRCNADSHNLYAESLLKRIGHEVTGQPGSWSNGATVVRMQVVERLGQDFGEFIMADGSGLSRDNRVTPLLMASWLGAIGRQSAIAQVFVDSLATPGEGSWTRRFADLKKLSSYFRGKSGFINNVLCLSGYLTNKTTGRRIAFSILVNDTNKAQPGSVRDLQEDVVRQIDNWLSRPSAGRAPGGG
jgi:D-alanyl-D-alanine carboxypeptidase/D-alanyl-D-alanine-endopeptidase (penicillin-binding protein 4)